MKQWGIVKKVISSVCVGAAIFGLVSTSANAETLYFEGGLGSAVQTIPHTGFNNTTESHVSSRIAVGYSQPIAMEMEGGLEVGYTNFGDATFQYTNTDEYKVRGSSVDLAGKVYYRVDELWSMFGKAGMAYMMSDVTDASTNTKTDDGAFKPLVGVGVRYSLDEALSLQASVTHYFGDKSVNADNTNEFVPVVDNFMFSIHYEFY